MTLRDLGKCLPIAQTDNSDLRWLIRNQNANWLNAEYNDDKLAALQNCAKVASPSSINALCQIGVALYGISD